MRKGDRRNATKQTQPPYAPNAAIPNTKFAKCCQHHLQALLFPKPHFRFPFTSPPPFAPLITTPSAPPYAFSFPLFLPVLTSRRLAQQQHNPVCTNQANIANALATHMNANMVVPTLAPMLISLTPLMTFRKMMNMAVAMMEAAVTKRALRKARMAMPRVHQREMTLMGMRNMRTKERQAEVRKRPNMT
jgi:hypothetical protein